MFGSRTHADPPLPEHADDWSDDRLASLRRRLTDAATTDPAQVPVLLDEVPDTSKNLASLIEQVVAEHARRAQSTGRARQVVDGPVPAGALAGVGHVLVVRWLTRREAMGRRVIRRVSYAPVTTEPSQRTGRLVLRHLAAQLAPATPA